MLDCGEHVQECGSHSVLLFLSFDEQYLEILAQSDRDIFQRYFFIIKLFPTLPYLPLEVWVGSSEIIRIWHTHISFYPEKCKRKKKTTKRPLLHQSSRVPSANRSTKIINTPLK